MIKDTLAAIYNSINTFDENKITLITYKDNTLTYQQVGKVVMLSNISLLYLPSKKYKFGVLTQQQLNNLRTTLIALIEDNRLDTQNALLCPTELGFQVYSLVDGLVGPQVIAECNLGGIRRHWLSKLLLKYSNSESRLLLKLLKSTKTK